MLQLNERHSFLSAVVARVFGGEPRYRMGSSPLAAGADTLYYLDPLDPRYLRGGLGGIYDDPMFGGGFRLPRHIYCGRCSKRIRGRYYKRRSPDGREVSVCGGCNSIIQFRLKTLQRQPQRQAGAAADQALSDLQEATRLNPDDETIAKNLQQARILRSRARGAPIAYASFFAPVCLVICAWELCVRRSLLSALGLGFLLIGLCLAGQLSIGFTVFLMLVLGVLAIRAKVIRL